MSFKYSEDDTIQYLIDQLPQLVDGLFAQWSIHPLGKGYYDLRVMCTIREGGTFGEGHDTYWCGWHGKGIKEVVMKALADERIKRAMPTSLSDERKL